MREQASLDDLAAQVVQAGGEALINISDMLAAAANRDDEEEF